MITYRWNIINVEDRKVARANIPAQRCCSAHHCCVSVGKRIPGRGKHGVIIATVENRDPVAGSCIDVKDLI